MTIWFTSDTHFYHNNIIKYCKRPFEDTEAMNLKILENWFSTVKGDDTIFHLGDLTIKRGSGAKPALEELIISLPGKKHLIRGNHDYYTNKFYLDAGFLSVNKRIETSRYILVHDPKHFSTPDKNSGKILIHGHKHNSKHRKRNGLLIDVGVDGNNFFPMDFAEIKEIYKKCFTS